MLDKNKSDISFINVKEFVELQKGVADSFYGTFNVQVISSSGKYLYKNIKVHTYYIYGYMDYRVEIIWEYDKTQPYYKDLGLHVYYSTNFQSFILKNDTLIFYDGENEITIY